jgi:hypothetical protein
MYISLQVVALPILTKESLGDTLLDVEAACGWLHEELVGSAWNTGVTPTTGDLTTPGDRIAGNS